MHLTLLTYSRNFERGKQGTNDEDDCESVFCVLAAKLSLFNSNFLLLPSQAGPFVTQIPIYLAT